MDNRDRKELTQKEKSFNHSSQFLTKNGKFGSPQATWSPILISANHLNDWTRNELSPIEYLMLGQALS